MIYPEILILPFHQNFLPNHIKDKNLFYKISKAPPFIFTKDKDNNFLYHHLKLSNISFKIINF